MITDKRYTVKLPNGGKMMVWYSGIDSSVNVRLQIGSFDKAVGAEISVDKQNEDFASACAIAEGMEVLLHNLMLEERCRAQGDRQDK